MLKYVIGETCMKPTEFNNLTNKEHLKKFEQYVNDILKNWKKKLSPLDKKVLSHFIKHSNVFTCFSDSYSLEKIKFESKKQLALELAQFFKIYVAFTSLRSREIDAENFELVSKIPFLLERITRGEEVYKKMPQVSIRLKKAIDQHDALKLLKNYSEAEQRLLKKLNDKDTEEVDNLLFSYGPAVISFRILMAEKKLNLSSGQMAEQIITLLEFHLSYSKSSKANQNSDVYKSITNLITSYRKDF